jgi:hypothetical protein
MIAKGKEFVFLIRHRLYYSYNQDVLETDINAQKHKKHK